MRRLLTFILWTAALAAAPALALDPADPAESPADRPGNAPGNAPADTQDGAETGMADIAKEDWRALVRGRTVTYSIGGEVWARETYDTGSDTVWIRLADGTCMDGNWSWADGIFCFDWSSGEYSCFRHVRSDGRILVIPMLAEGLGVGTIQTVTQISDVPASCGPELTS